MNEITKKDSNPDINLLINAICKNEAILVLGPDLMFNFENALLKEFSKFLKDQEIAHNFNDDEELFSSKTQFDGEVFLYRHNFFESQKPGELHLKIAQIPFHAIILLSPDLVLKNAFEKQNFQYDFKFYHKGKQQEEIKLYPTEKVPMLYNLLGNFEAPDSMVLCFDHLFDYLISIFGKYELPAIIRDVLKKGQTIFFLGFKYERWYFKLIMRLIDLENKMRRQASSKEVEGMNGVVNFYSSEFQFKFIKDLTGNEIVDRIHKYFCDNNMLRLESLPDSNLAPNDGNLIGINGNGNIGLQGVTAETITINISKP
jgi:hypothetical protein